MFAKKSGSILLMLAIIAISNIEFINAQGTVFSNVDVTKVAGAGIAVKAAADGFCGADLSTEELMRRYGLGETAELNFFNPLLLQNFRNVPLSKALTCQKNRNKIMKDTCERAAAVKTNNQCQIKKNDIQIGLSIASVDKNCAGVNETLFITVTGINDPAPIAKKNIEVCGTYKKEGPFTTKYSEVDITKTPGDGEQARLAAQTVCGQDLSVGELMHRSNIAMRADASIYTLKLVTAIGNATMTQALNCQKARNRVMRSECVSVAARKRLRDFNVQMEILKQRSSMESVNTFCTNADPNLFV